MVPRLTGPERKPEVSFGTTSCQRGSCSRRFLNESPDHEQARRVSESDLAIIWAATRKRERRWHAHHGLENGRRSAADGFDTRFTGKKGRDPSITTSGALIGPFWSVGILSPLAANGIKPLGLSGQLGNVGTFDPRRPIVLRPSFTIVERSSLCQGACSPLGY